MAHVTRRKFFQLFGIAAVTPALVKEAAAAASQPAPEPWKDQMFEIVPAGTPLPYTYDGYDRVVYETSNPDVENGRKFWLVPLEFDTLGDGRRMAEKTLIRPLSRSESSS